MAALRLADLDLEGGYVHVRSGKGDKDRVVPVSPATGQLTYTYTWYRSGLFLSEPMIQAT